MALAEMAAGDSDLRDGWLGLFHSNRATQPGRLADHEAHGQHRVLGQLDERDLQVQPAHHPTNTS